MTRNTRTLIAVALLTSFLPLPALAADPGFYVAANAGRAEETPGKSLGTNFATGFPPTAIQRIYPTRIDVDNGSVAWGAGVGYRLNAHLAAEVEYIDFGSTNISEHYTISLPNFPFFTTQFTNTYSSKIDGPALSLLGSIPVGKAWDLFLRAGVLFADREIKYGQPLGPDSNTFGSKVWLAGAGVDWSLANRCSLRAEYQRTGNLDATFLTSSTKLERLSLGLLFKL